MEHTLDRREFLKVGTAGIGLGLVSTLPALSAPAFKGKLHKALIVGTPSESNMKPLKEAGFDGVEAGITSPEEAANSRKEANKLGMCISSVLRGWAEFNSDNKGKVDGSVATTVAALKAAQGYGADAVLLVPCRIDGVAMPAPWDFRVHFDDNTGHLTAVADKENDKYRPYMDAHDKAYDMSRAAIQRLIPVAGETGVVIAVENVWNNMFVDPVHLAHFIDSFKSPWVKIYFDIGNHVKYSPPEHWISVLKDRIVKCHVKDFKLNSDGHDGRFVDICDGSVNWPVVRKALDDISYCGWMTIEGSDDLSLQERSMRLDRIIKGLV